VNFLDIVYAAVALATAPAWSRKTRSGWRQRFGHVADMLSTPPPPPAAAPDPSRAPSPPRRPRLLLHTVSVGETSAIRSLVALLTPRADVIVSASTDTGLARAQALYSTTCQVVRYPLDASWAVRRFLDAVQPDAVALVELEVWPNFIAACRRRAIPVCVINGRLSERSFRGYRRLRPFLRPTFAALHAAMVQDEAYRSRFIAMGVPEAACTVTGSMKWDAVDLARASASPGEKAATIAREMGIDRARPLIVAGSTAEGEEALFHAACPPGAQLLVAPRKPERFDLAALALPGCTRRSTGQIAPPGCDRFLLDTIGELSAAYELADLVIIGRSFTPQRGSDPTEPIALGKPTLAGPSMDNFAAIAATLESADALTRTDAAGLPAALEHLLTEPTRRDAQRERGLACVLAHQGASQAHAARLIEIAHASSLARGA
jgi:3-deoxy-D-manno-octulosonic-acid transferase